MNVLITGAAGFTARHLVTRLRGQGAVHITGTDVAASGPMLPPLQAYVCADLTDPAQALAVVRRTRPEWIFHLAGLFRGAVADMYRVNLLAGLNLLEAVRTAAPDAAVLLVGSAAEYGIWPAAQMPLAEDHPCQPISAYGASKYALTLAAQAFHRESGLKVIVARPFNLIGAGLPPTLVVGAIVQRAKTALANGQSSITVGNTGSQRDFVAVEDAVEAYLRLLQAGAWGEVFNVCSGEARSIESVLQTLLSFCPKPFELVPDEQLKRWNDPPLVIGDLAKIHRVCGFLPRMPLHQALRAVWESAVAPVRAA